MDFLWIFFFIFLFVIGAGLSYLSTKSVARRKILAWTEDNGYSLIEIKVDWAETFVRRAMIFNIVLQTASGERREAVVVSDYQDRYFPEKFSVRVKDETEFNYNRY